MNTSKKKPEKNYQKLKSPNLCHKKKFIKSLF